MRDLNDQYTQQPLVSTSTRLRFVSPTRLYSATLEVDLLGDWIVCQAWCGRDSKRGGGKTVVVESEEKGLALHQAIVKRGEQHGYELQEQRA